MKVRNYLCEDQTNTYWFTNSMTYDSVRGWAQTLDYVDRGVVVTQQDAEMREVAMFAMKQPTVDNCDHLLDVDPDKVADFNKYCESTWAGFLLGKTLMSKWDQFVQTTMTKYKGEEIR